MDEVWKDVKGYEGYYQVSNKGRVRSLDRVVPEKNGRSHFVKGTLLKQRYNDCGYPIVYLRIFGKGKNIKVHRLVAIAFVNNPKNFLEVNHIDENKLNNDSSNLEWCTREYNNNYGTINKRRGETLLSRLA